jgi:hypothetical protein
LAAKCSSARSAAFGPEASTTSGRRTMNSDPFPRPSLLASIRPPCIYAEARLSSGSSNWMASGLRRKFSELRGRCSASKSGPRRCGANFCFYCAPAALASHHARPGRASTAGHSQISRARMRPERRHRSRPLPYAATGITPDRSISQSTACSAVDAAVKMARLSSRIYSSRDATCGDILRRSCPQHSTVITG